MIKNKINVMIKDCQCIILLCLLYIWLNDNEIIFIIISNMYIINNN